MPQLPRRVPACGASFRIGGGRAHAPPRPAPPRRGEPCPAPALPPSRGAPPVRRAGERAAGGRGAGWSGAAFRDPRRGVAWRGAAWRAGRGRGGERGWSVLGPARCRVEAVGAGGVLRAGAGRDEQRERPAPGGGEPRSCAASCGALRCAVSRAGAGAGTAAAGRRNEGFVLPSRDPPGPRRRCRLRAERVRPGSAERTGRRAAGRAASCGTEQGGRIFTRGCFLPAG